VRVVNAESRDVDVDVETATPAPGATATSQAEFASSADFGVTTTSSVVAGKVFCGWLPRCKG
jgi:hypothetical protein